MTRVSGAWLDHPGTQQVLEVLTAAGHRALLVGGCVRNALLGVAVGDIDIATDAVPEDVLRIGKTAGLRVVPTGVDHGTVTVIAHGVPHEVTTFRRDVQTDGRHAVVRFSTSVEEDARRRDFTMNALYAGADGTVYDPLGGIGDLAARRVRFIDDPTARITEDHLRILRFFRFHAWYGDPEQGLDREGLAACAALADGIARLSRERVGAELLKLLAAPDPAPAVAAMQQAGVLARVLPGADSRALPILIHREQDAQIAPDPLRRLAALGGEMPDLRLSRRAATRLTMLRDGVGTTAGPGELAWRHGADAARDIVLLRAALFETELPGGWPDQIARAASAEFPVRAADLMPAFQGRALGDRLSELEARWIASDFTATRDDLLG